MIVLLNQQLAEILPDLRSLFPRSLPMYTMIRNRLSKWCDWPGTEFVSDDFPNYSVIIRRPIVGSQEYVGFPRCYAVSVFCKSAKSMEHFLKVDGCIDFSDPVLFFAVSRNDAYPVIMEVCKEVGYTQEQDPPDQGTVFLLHPDHLKQRSLPAGLRIGQLNEEHAEQVNKQWRYGSENTLAFFRQLLRLNYPSSAIFNEEDNRLVAYIMYQPDGSMGHAYVLPEFRNKGLFQIVNYQLAQKLVSGGQDTAWVYVLKWNNVSQNAYRRLGAKCVDDEVLCVDWIHFYPLKHSKR